MRILLIEDHPIVRAGCRRLLEATDSLQVIEADSAAEGLRLGGEICPDLIVLDLKLPDGNGLDLLASLTARKPAPKVIVFSMYEDAAFVARALGAGAKGYLSKNDDPDILLEAIEAVAAGGIFLTPAMSAKLALMTANRNSDPVHDLSSREIEVLNLLAQGRTLAEIADELKISYRTSASVTAQIKSKLNLPSTAALIKWAVERPC